MISLIDPRLWLATVILCLACFFAGEWSESRTSKATMKAADDAAKVELATANENARETGRILKKEVSTISDARTQEQERAKTTIDALRADVRTGTVRLSIATRPRDQAGSGADPSAGDREARSELVPEAAIALIDIAADGDDAVRDLNACVDKYAAVRQAINP